MSKLTSLILLVKSLSKSEKKALTLFSPSQKKSLYLILFKIIDKDNYVSEDSISKVFYKKFPGSSLSANVQYLFDLILQVIVNLNIRKNNEYELYNSYLKTKILRERGLYDDCLSLIHETKEKAKQIEEYNLLLTLQRDELQSDMLDYFDHIKEKELFNKQQEVNNNLKIIKQINEQSFLYEMLRFRIEKQKIINANNLYIYNDLLISEMTLVSGLNNEIFKISRQHQLFQANYFISIGSNKNALKSFSELNNLYLKNEHLWNNPPVYYVMVLEGVLESLNRMRLFEEMNTYKDQLLSLAQKYPYVNFTVEVNAIVFLYSVSSYMHNHEPKKCVDLITQYQEILLDRLTLLPPRLFLSMNICLSGIYFMNNDLANARRQLAPIIQNNTFNRLKLFRSAQLLNLIIYYELEDTDYIEAVIRSIKIKNKKSNKETQIERLLFRYLKTDWKILSKEKENKLKKKLKSEIESIRYNVEDLQLIKVFDFREWTLTKLK